MRWAWDFDGELGMGYILRLRIVYDLWRHPYETLLGSDGPPIWRQSVDASNPEARRCPSPCG